MGFRITGTGSGPVDPADAFNGANDFFDIAPGQTWTGEFIPVPAAIARGDNAGKLPQDDLERLVERQQHLPVHPGRGHRL